MLVHSSIGIIVQTTNILAYFLATGQIRCVLSMINESISKKQSPETGSPD
jgi:hypothetical protein